MAKGVNKKQLRVRPPELKAAVRRSRRLDAEPAGTSPSASGPSGASLEMHVGAQYLLPLLTAGEARGLPGVVVTQVSFQQAGFGHPMDDVIVTGHDQSGARATLELQAKRTVSFTASDNVFKNVVALACRAAVKPEFASGRYELAVAVTRTSTKIEQHIQEVLRWSRTYPDGGEFFRRLRLPRAATAEMREFVEIFRANMELAGAKAADDDVWRLLSRFQILAFDFEQPGSLCMQWAQERCALQLSPSQSDRAADLWEALQIVALELDTAGGAIRRDKLLQDLIRTRGFVFASDRRLFECRELLMDMSRSGLADIDMEVNGTSIDRSGYVEQASRLLATGRYLEIRGSGGVGKSGVLKAMCQMTMQESKVLFVSPNRVIGGGWAALRSQLNCSVSAPQLLADLAGDGCTVMFVDGLDRFDSAPQQATVVDLFRAAVQVPGFLVVATARMDFDSDAREWLPTDAINGLGATAPLIVEDLTDDEVEFLRDEDAALSSLLAKGHPAEKLSRNLYRLNRLVRSIPAGDGGVLTEAQMAWQWWLTGDSSDSTGRIDRRRVLTFIGEHSLLSSEPMSGDTMSATALEALISSGSLRQVNSVDIELKHDVLRDWAVASLIYENSAKYLEIANIRAPVPVRIARGVELAARFHAEFDVGHVGWHELVRRLGAKEAHGSWRRLALLALPRSERGVQLLSKCSPVLLIEDPSLLADMVRMAIAFDSQPAATFWNSLGLVEMARFADNQLAPQGTSWMNLVVWSMKAAEQLPSTVVPRLVDLYGRWCTAWLGQDPLSPALIGRMFHWLELVEAKNSPNSSDLQSWLISQQSSGLQMSADEEEDLRTAALMWARLRPAEASNYVRRWSRHRNRHIGFRHLLSFIGSLPQAAPEDVADLFIAALPDGDKQNQGALNDRQPFSSWDMDYFPATPARAPFLDLLQANGEQGLRLIRWVVAYAVKKGAGDQPQTTGITIQYPTGARTFPWYQTYFWSRSHHSNIVSSALMALEAWGHVRIERGDNFEDVLDEILGPAGSSAAFLLVAVDLMLSYWPRSREIAWIYASSPDLLAIDHQRAVNDLTNGRLANVGWVRPEPPGLVRLESLLDKPSRRVSLNALIAEYGVGGPPKYRDAMQLLLKAETTVRGAPRVGADGLSDPAFAAMWALNRLDSDNYLIKVNEQGEEVHEYIPPQAESNISLAMTTRASQAHRDIAMRLRASTALKEKVVSQEFLQEAVTWAKEEETAADIDADEQEWIARTRLIVAALLVRDGAPEMKVIHEQWARQMLIVAARLVPLPSSTSAQVEFNDRSIALIGFLALLRDSVVSQDLRLMLELISQRSTRAASVLRIEIDGNRLPSDKLLRSMIRLGFVSSIYALTRHDALSASHGDEADYTTRRQESEALRIQADNELRQSAVEAEYEWQVCTGMEPSLPELPLPRPPKKRFSIRLDRTFEVDAQAKKRAISQRYALNSSTAAQWINVAQILSESGNYDSMPSLLSACATFSSAVNGDGCDDDEEPSESAHEWNHAYFSSVTYAQVTTADFDAATFVNSLIKPLSEDRLLDVTAIVLQQLDELWFNRHLVSDISALLLRKECIDLLRSSKSWRHLLNQRSMGITMHLGSAIASIFMADYNFGRSPECYVKELGIDRADLVQPLLASLVEEAPGAYFIASAYLSLLEVAPNPQQLTFVLRATKAWWTIQQGNDSFWVDHGVGRRLCEWVKNAVLTRDSPESGDALRSSALTELVDLLVQCGAPMAGKLEGDVTLRRAKLLGE